MLVMIALSLVSQASIDANEFGKLIAGLHAEVRDVTLVVEGGIEALDDRVAATFDVAYQSQYSFRSDGASLLDGFQRPLKSDAPGSRAIRAVRGGTMEVASETPDLGYSEPQVQGGAPGVLNAPGSPERILYLWLLAGLKDPAQMGYRFLGWEDIDGHRCLNIQFYQVPEKEVAAWEGTAPVVRLWIDMERGGHPLRAEFLRGDEPQIVVDQIELRELPLGPARSLWFPVRGRATTPGDPSAVDDRGMPKAPPCVETYAVVDGSVRFNQGLPDTYFTVRRKGAKFDDAEMRRLQSELNAARRPPFRTDPEGVQQRLDAQLATAEEQSRLLDASAPSTLPGGWSAILLGAVGICLLGVAFLWRRLA